MNAISNAPANAEPVKRGEAPARDAGEPDPIFALIDAVRLAKAAHEAALKIEYAIKEEANAAVQAKYGDGRRGQALEDEYPPLKAVREKNDSLSTIQCDAENAVLDAKPRTLAGLAAQLIFAAEIWVYDDLSGFLIPLLVNAAQMIDGPLVSKIALSKQLAERLSDDEDQEA
jgi:hypothetical protein